ncbi:STAS domain-containing protein [Sorangium sp. So ce1151]|uniref:STAS domain-containing protein n=1 Tax=Sorangium sp. So ce1151 TaxID=3133332 RepID=UPI003F618804
MRTGDVGEAREAFRSVYGEAILEVGRDAQFGCALEAASCSAIRVVTADWLIGAIDDVRADHIRSVLLNGIMTHAARVAILDVTGVPSVDQRVAEALLGTAKAARLLGVEVRSFRRRHRREITGSSSTLA